VVASAENFELGIFEALDSTRFSPRRAVLDVWSWNHSIAKLARLVDNVTRSPLPVQIALQQGMSA
jgi:hypothetical protein